MHIALWILLCLLASIGLVYGLSWLASSAVRPKQVGSAFQVIPLSRDPELLEQQLRYELHLLRWSDLHRPQTLILLDTGLGREARDICQKMTRPLGGAIICAPEELAGLLCREEGRELAT